MGELTTEVFDLTGRKLMDTSFHINSAGLQRETINIKYLKIGVYILKAYYGDGASQSAKLMVK